MGGFFLTKKKEEETLASLWVTHPPVSKTKGVGLLRQETDPNSKHFIGQPGMKLRVTNPTSRTRTRTRTATSRLQVKKSRRNWRASSSPSQMLQSKGQLLNSIEAVSLEALLSPAKGEDGME